MTAEKSTRMFGSFLACTAAVRVELYRRISALGSVKERDELYAELKDAYETVPQEVKNLCNVGLAKNLAAAINATAVTLLRSGAKLEFADARDIPQGFEKFGGVLNASKDVVIVFDSAKSLARFLQQARGAAGNKD